MQKITNFIFNFLSCFVPSKKTRRYLRKVGDLGSVKSVCSFYNRLLFNKSYVKKYRAYKKKRKARLVVYSCITNAYDRYQKIKNVNFDYDYIMFTDNMNDFKEDEHIWEFRNVEFNELDKHRNSRYVKLNPHRIFPEYEESLWIDGNVNIVSDLLYRDIETARKNKKLFAISNHPKRNCLYKEYKVLCDNKIDDLEVMGKQIKEMKADGFPENFGLFENGFMYRKHNDKNLIKLHDKWWDYVANRSKRDQLSLVYLSWKYNVKIAKLNPVSYTKLGADVFMATHNKAKK